MTDAPKLALKPGHEHAIMIIGGIASIVGLALFIRAQAAGASAGAGLGGPVVAGDTGGGTADGAITQQLAAYQQHTDAALTSIQTDFEHQIGTTNDNLTQTQTDFQQALDDLKNSITGDGTHGGATFAIDLSTAGSYTDKNDNSWDNSTDSHVITESGSSSSHDSHGSGGISFMGISLGGGGGGSGTSTSYNKQDNDFATHDSGTQLNDVGTTFSQNIKVAGSGLSDDALYLLTHEAIYTARNAQTAAVDPGALVPSQGFGVHPNSPGAAGYNRPATYTHAADVGADSWINNWGAQSFDQLPKAALHP